MSARELREMAREVHVLQQRLVIWGETSQDAEDSKLLQRVEHALCRAAGALTKAREVWTAGAPNFNTGMYEVPFVAAENFPEEATP